jgi:HEPN domain-containing protein
VPDNFAETADTMMQDAVKLHRDGSHRNACYLAGYVVECTMKVLLQQAGASTAPKVHDLESLHDEIVALTLLGNAIIARYGDPSALAPTMMHQVSPAKTKGGKVVHYCHWDPGHRYDGARWVNPTASADYLREADRCHETIIQMTLDGVL